MKYKFFEEPNLEFGQSVHICPRTGIAEFGAYDIKFKNRRKEIQIGAIGSKENLISFFDWLNDCSKYIPAKPKNNQPNLFLSFPGFSATSGFYCELQYDEEFSRIITKQDITKIILIKKWNERISACVDLYLEHLQYLAIDKGLDIIICIIPKGLIKHIMNQSLQPVEELIEETEKEHDDKLETDFRRLLKAKSMRFGKPIQLILQDSLESYKEKSGKQDNATKAWNFFTALYYKTNHTPWRLLRDNSRITTCFAGISFYKTRDKQSVHTTLAQLFDDLGNGVILRGSTVEISEEDRQPHLKQIEAFRLLKGMVDEYHLIHYTNPARIVLHKTSNYDDEEICGFNDAAQELRLSYLDLITIHDANTRLFREGLYPPQRGSCILIDETIHLLFTKGSVEFYQTYPGLYVPKPLEIRIIQSEESAETICREVLSLTKMNWNNTQLDGKYPITIECARRVGLIMKYIPENVVPQSKYSFYM